MTTTHDLTFGLNEGELVHISQVDRGLSCDCVCPACEHPLVARKGKKVRHHFAHHRGSTCEYGVETALHLAAKDILDTHKRMLIPTVEVPIWGGGRDSWRIHDSQIISFDDVILESRLGRIIPDILVYVQGHPLMIEIAVTHHIDDEKLLKIRDLNISTIEIDASKLSRDINRDELTELLIDSEDHKTWVFNKKVFDIYQYILKIMIDKQTIRRGFALHVDNCPIPARVWKGKPYANVIDDCSSCEFIVGHSSPYSTEEEKHKSYDKDNVGCIGHLKIGSYQDYQEFVASQKQ